MNLLTALMLAPLLAMAPQEEESAAPTATGSETQESTTDDPVTRDEFEALKAELAETKGRLDTEESDQDVAVTREEYEALKAELAETKEQLEESELADLEEMTTGEEDRGVEIFGFFDVNFARFFVNENSFFHGLLPSSSSFFVQNLNLYFSNQMTETLSFLTELRFTFRPLGQELGYELAGLSDYDRVDTTVTETHNNSSYQLGGVAIERVHLTWQPKDWFGVIAGRYLTPFGIWNVDHGSPVLIGVHPPFIQSARLVPLAQTGLQIFGRFYPGDDSYVDYAITVSNGRGPTEAIIDLDEHKGLGLRLRYLYRGKDVSFALGSYGYWGTYADTKRAMELAPEFDMLEEITESYTEYSVTGDALLEFFGVRLQAEYGRSLIEYSKRPLRDIMTGVSGYQPDHARDVLYGLVAYTLPLERLMGAMTLTPFFVFEHADLDDSLPDNKAYVLDGGLNFKPSPFVVLKLDYAYVEQYQRTNTDFSKISLQLAVSF